MGKFLSRVARKLGLVAVHVTVVRQRRGTIKVIESTFPCEFAINVCHNPLQPAY
jgi:hypothetical protein